MTQLKILDLRFNDIHCVPVDFEQQKFILLDGNPMGEETFEEDTQVLAPFFINLP